MIMLCGFLNALVYWLAGAISGVAILGTVAAVVFVLCVLAAIEVPK